MGEQRHVQQRVDTVQAAYPNRCAITT